MTSNDNQMSNYDIAIMKKNINKLIADKNITQSKLAEIAGTSQSRVSKILNLETSDCFTIQQLVAIAQALHVSTDSILGIKVHEKSETIQEISLADICTKLFEIDDLADLSLGVCEASRDKYRSNSPKDNYPCIFFRNQSIADFIAEWDGMNKLNVQNSKLSDNIYSTWKSGIVTCGKSKLKKYNFKEKEDYQKHLAQAIVDSFDTLTLNSEPVFPLLFSQDEKLLKEYISSGAYKQDFDEDSQALLLDYFESNCLDLDPEL